MSFDFGARVERARAEMERRGIDCLLLSVGADLPYLIGYEAMALERLTMLVVTPDNPPVLVVPELEAARVEPGPFVIEPWREGTDAIGAVVSAAGRPSVAAVGDRTWAMFLLGMMARMTETTFVSSSAVMADLRIRKEAAELAALRAASAAVDRVAGRLPQIQFGGRSERAIARDVVDLTIEEGHDRALFWIVASGENSASPHHEPGSRVVGDGDAVVVDFGGRMSGYCSDTTRTFVVGEPDVDLRVVHSVVLEAQESGRLAAKAGETCEAVDRAARSVIEAAGFGPQFIHRLGHGIGLEEHEPPYLIRGNDRRLEAGMAFSIEPGVYLPERFGVRIEDICVISDEGVCESLNNSDRQLVSVE